MSPKEYIFLLFSWTWLHTERSIPSSPKINSNEKLYIEILFNMSNSSCRRCFRWKHRRRLLHIAGSILSRTATRTGRFRNTHQSGHVHQNSSLLQFINERTQLFGYVNRYYIWTIAKCSTVDVRCSRWTLHLHSACRYGNSWKNHMFFVFAIICAMIFPQMPELSSAHKTLEQFILQILGMCTGVTIMLLIALYEGDLLSVFSSTPSTSTTHKH